MAISEVRYTLSSDSGAADYVTNNPKQTLRFVYDHSGVLEDVRVFINGIVVATDTQVPGDENGRVFEVPFTFNTDGTYTIQVGTNATTSGAVTLPSVVLDRVAPVVSNLTVAGNDVVDSGEQRGFSVTGSVSGAEGRTVTVSIRDGATVVASAKGTVSGGAFTATFIDLTLPDSGTYTVKASVTDLAGNVGSTTEDFDSTACFLPGTMIATPEGERAIETLAIGDLVVTSEGKTAPIRWIGRNTVSLIFADKLRTLPIRVTAGALDENVPSRDLLVSPDHALLVDGVLVHAGALVNGSTIVRETNVPSVFTYFHVELEDHSLILAENTPAETFIDNIDRMAFDNWAEHEALHAGSAPLVEMDLPRAKAHRQVAQATRRRLAERGAALLPMAKIA